MKVRLAYGQGHLPVELPDKLTTLIEPAHTPGLSDERGAVLAALEKPIAARPLREWVKPASRVCIAFTDITRATPNERLIPWLLDCLPDDIVCAAHLTPCHDISATVKQLLKTGPSGPRLAALPQGPLTIPYLG